MRTQGDMAGQSNDRLVGWIVQHRRKQRIERGRREYVHKLVARIPIESESVDRRSRLVSSYRTRMYE